MTVLSQEPCCKSSYPLQPASLVHAVLSHLYFRPYCTCDSSVVGFFLIQRVLTWSFSSSHQETYFFFLLLPVGTLVTTAGATRGASSCVTDSSDSLKSALLESNGFSAAAASCLFASSASLPAISLSEQSLNLMHCKSGETDIYWLSNYSYIHSINCHREAENLSSYHFKSDLCM